MGLGVIGMGNGGKRGCKTLLARCDIELRWKARSRFRESLLRVAEEHLAHHDILI